MKFNHLALTAVLLAFISAGVQAAAPKADLLKALDLPTYPGAKAGESITVSGPLLQQLEKEIGESLPISNIKSVDIANYSIDPSVDSTDVAKFYDPAFAAQKWTTMVSTVDRQGDATIVLTNEKMGLLIVDIDPPADDRELSFMLVSGTVDTSKLKNDKRAAEAAGALVSGAKPGIPTGKPISVPPSEKLDIQSTKSSLIARFASQNTVQLSLMSKVDNNGEMSRTPDGRLLMVLAPTLEVDEIRLPSGVPVLLEPTDGSLTVLGGSGMNEKPTRLSIVSTGAPVKLDSMPLVGGTHNIKVVGKSFDALFSQVQGGVMEVEVQGGNINVILPVNSSVRLDASTVSGSIQNSATADKPNGSNLSFKMGDGKAQITLKALNGSITIKASQ